MPTFLYDELTFNWVEITSGTRATLSLRNRSAFSLHLEASRAPLREA